MLLKIDNFINDELKVNLNKSMDKDYRDFLESLNELLYFSQLNNSLDYQVRIIDDKIVTNLSFTWDLIKLDTEMTKRDFINMCKRYNVLQGTSKDYYKVIVYKNERNKSFLFDIETIKELLEEA